MRLSISVFLSSSSCCSSSLSAALILDFPSFTFFFFTRARASCFVVFRMLEVLLLISPSLPSRVTRLTSFYLGLTSLTRTTSESSFSSSMSIFCSSSLSSLGRAFFAATALSLALGFAEDGVTVRGIFVNEKVVARLLLASSPVHNLLF